MSDHQLVSNFGAEAQGNLLSPYRRSPRLIARASAATSHASSASITQPHALASTSLSARSGDFTTAASATCRQDASPHASNSRTNDLGPHRSPHSTATTSSPPMPQARSRSNIVRTYVNCPRTYRSNSSVAALTRTSTSTRRPSSDASDDLTRLAVAQGSRAAALPSSEDNIKAQLCELLKESCLCDICGGLMTEPYMYVCDSGKTTCN
jgi:hypothetical protein